MRLIDVALLLSVFLVSEISCFKATPLLTMQNGTHLNYTALSRRYQEAPGHLVTTSRHSGLAVWNTSAVGLQLVSFFGSNRSFEGQDRLGDTLVVIDMHANSLLVFRVTGTSYTLHYEHRIAVPSSGALHVKLHRKQRSLYAIVSTGYAPQMPANDHYLVFLRLGAQEATQVAALHGAGIPRGIEGINVDAEHQRVYVGGFHSTLWTSVDISDPEAPRVSRVQQRRFFSQMVGTQRDSLMYIALWGLNGAGLARFKAGELIDYISDNSTMPYANRAHLDAAGHYVFMPLEAYGRGAAVVDVRERLAFVANVPLPPGDRSTCYALDIHQGVLLIFAAQSSTVYGFSISHE